MNVGAINNAVPVTLADLGPTRMLTQDQRTLIQAIKAVNASGSLGDENEVTYSVDRAARQVVVKLVNKKTGDVLQQIPTEYVLKMAEELNRG